MYINLGRRASVGRYFKKSWWDDKRRKNIIVWHSLSKRMMHILLLSWIKNIIIIIQLVCVPHLSSAQEKGSNKMERMRIVASFLFFISHFRTLTLFPYLIHTHSQQYTFIIILWFFIHSTQLAALQRNFFFLCGVCVRDKDRWKDRKIDSR